MSYDWNKSIREYLDTFWKLKGNYRCQIKTDYRLPPKHTLKLIIGYSQLFMATVWEQTQRLYD